MKVYPRIFIEKLTVVKFPQFRISLPASKEKLPKETGEYTTRDITLKISTLSKIIGQWLIQDFL